jgi:iron complex transport system ATP-binding protein
MQPSLPPVIECLNLGVSVPGRKLVENLALALSSGEFLAILGQNGAGKTLTLHTLAGLRAPATGSIRLNGVPLSDLSRRQIATGLALVPQDADDVFPATVQETVLVGRHPHIRAFQWESPADHNVARGALACVGLAAFADRDVTSLSGGERRRVAIAQALTQQPGLFLLDEPTNHLDPQHQLQIMRLFAAAAGDGGTVIASLHDVNLAARFATRCLLLHGNGIWELGATAEILNVDGLSNLYRTPMEAVPWRDGQLFIAAS